MNAALQKCRRVWSIALCAGWIAWSGWPGPVHADSFRCGRKVVRSGDTEEQVVARCGEPGRRDSAHETLWLPGGQQRVRVERWHYKLGTRQLERVILLYQGRVVAVQSGAR